MTNRCFELSYIAAREDYKMTAEEAAQVGPDMHIQEACRGAATDLRDRLATARQVMSGDVKPTARAKARAVAHLRGLTSSIEEIISLLE